MTGQGTGVRLAVMEDDTVLCADCVHGYQAEALPETTATIVHALAGESDWRGVPMLRRNRYRGTVMSGDRVASTAAQRMIQRRGPAGGPRSVWRT